ncbi:hypothetical protein GCM10010363_49270 [Streptomyces omiyaensis]|uniref:hypothetical protein n=1 Tax=Streptomyces omiyaensis TaxID=68247 RepID=UPI001672B16F|nr:hypothetical protein [Streptomyces omiyaensis]GGY61919.1 hypothetical protein GCM10010363_49270 [Streptomyces omiyaensis]
MAMMMPLGAVAIPAAGAHIVINGVVHELDPGSVHVTWDPSIRVRTFEARTVPKPVFFEAGKTYTRSVDWSIAAQVGDLIEGFECTVVEKDGDGNPVAFGRFTTAKGGTRGLGIDLWYLMQKYHWEKGGWKADGGG